MAERLSTAYDAMSRRQTACLVSAVSEILVYDPAEESLKTLLGAAREALQVCLLLFSPKLICRNSGSTTKAQSVCEEREQRREKQIHWVKVVGKQQMRCTAPF